MMKFLRFWFPVISYSGMIFYVSGLPNLDTGFGFSHLDKFLHIVEYAILGSLFARALRGTKATLSFSRLIVFTFLFAISFGISDEWHQMFIPGRNASVVDVLSDSVGGLIGAFSYLWAVKRRTL